MACRNFEGLSSPSAGQGSVSAAMINFTSQKWQYFTDNPTGAALLSPLLAVEHVGPLAGAPGSCGGNKTRRMSWSSSAPVHVLGCFCPLCCEKWLLVEAGGGTVAPPDGKSLLASLGSPIP